MLTMDFHGFKVIGTETSGNTCYVTIAAQVDVSLCPNCGYASSQVHSTYVRHLRDLPVLGRPVRLRALVRRFRCRVQGCGRKTFSEPLGGLAEAHAQRTQRVTSTLQSLILCTSSITGSRLATQMGIQTSPRTLLRVANDGERSVAAPRVLGVDDFALRRGRTYGTILCDLETGRTVDILPGRSAEPLTRWLQQHPGVQIIARDRASAYADAARQGAPAAIQVADRFHLVRNVSDALREVVDRQPWALPKPTASPVSVGEPVPCAMKRSPQAVRLAEAAAERLRLRYEEVLRRFRNGESFRSISKATGLERKTVRTYTRSVEVPKRAARRPAPRTLDPFIDYIGDRWRSGCHNARKLFQEIRERGYTGSESMVRHTVRPWRSAMRQSSKEQGSGARRYVWKDVRWAILSPSERLRQDQQDCLKELFALHPKLELAYNLVQRFRHILRDRQAENLDQWLQDAGGSELAPFARLARTLTADRSAVLAAFELPWNTGRVEGIITRVKLVKRIGYGRASFPLLRARIVGAC
jgi:transposase